MEQNKLKLLSISHNGTKNTKAFGCKRILSELGFFAGIAIILAVAMLTGCQTESKRPIDKDLLTEAEVIDFITKYDQAWSARDTTQMKEMMDSSYIYFTSTGKTTDRTAIIGWFTPADKYKVDTAVRSEVRVVQIKSNTAIVSSRWVGNGTFGDEKFDDDQRCGFVIRKEDGQLKLLSEHCTQIVK